MKRWLTFFFLLIGCKSSAQTTTVPLKRSFPVITGYSQYLEDPFAVGYNQACLASIKQPAFGAYNERRFMMKELSMVLFALVLPHHTGGYGLNITHAGNKLYNETSFALSFGRKLTEQLALGIEFGYFLNKVAGGRTVSAITCEIGSICRLSEKILAGFHISNPVTSSLNADGDKLPLGYAFGVGYDLSTQLLLSALIEKEGEMPADLAVALQYYFIPAFYIKTGINGQLQKLFLAIGLKWQKKIIEISGGYHDQLGFTPALSLVFPFGKSKGE